MKKSVDLALEWIPGAEAVWLRGDFNDWARTEYAFSSESFGKWSIRIPAKEDGSCRIRHNSKIKLTILVRSTGKLIDRISPWAKYVYQEPNSVVYDWHFYNPSSEEKYAAKFDRPEKPKAPRIYEAHVGIASDKEWIEKKKSKNFQKICNIEKFNFFINAIEFGRLKNVIQNPKIRKASAHTRTLQTTCFLASPKMVTT